MRSHLHPNPTKWDPQSTKPEPGGYPKTATRSEDELAGGIAHEIAHVTQRHIARALAAGKKQSLLSTAIMLGAVIAGAAGAGSDAVQGAMAVAQGTQMQQQINFTRENEHEADRIGISALARACFDPRGMASFFEVMSINFIYDSYFF